MEERPEKGGLRPLEVQHGKSREGDVRGGGSESSEVNEDGGWGLGS